MPKNAIVESKGKNGLMDPLLTMTMALKHNKGAYAILTGSGISRAAGIPTGWEMVLDLAKKLAHLESEETPQDLELWYFEKFSKELNYSDLLQSIAKTPTARNNLLKSYFEPSEEEREQGFKLPTKAHKAIASLVEMGYVKVIITTNFDRLQELALQQVGITPTVISNQHDLKGALPVQHSRCTVIKVHGDYLDTRIKNTPEELREYDKDMNCLLDRIFDEYGLIVCGWSAEWDTALRDCIKRCKNHRFPWYWAVKGDLNQGAQDIINARRIEQFLIQDADTFFLQLLEKVTALEELDAPHPLSVKTAVASLKRYIVTPENKIRLHDLMMTETERVYEGLSETYFPLNAPHDPDSFLRRMHQYESLCETLMNLLLYGAYWGDVEDSHLWIRSLERIANPPTFQSGPVKNLLLSLRLYPALLLLYCAGIAAVASNNYNMLFKLLTGPKARHSGLNENVEIALSINPNIVMDFNFQKQIPGYNTWSFPLSKYLFECLRQHFKDLLPEDTLYEKTFDCFEYFSAIQQLEISQARMKRDVFNRGLFAYKPEFTEKIGSKIEQYGEHWPPLAAGLFGGSLEKLNKLKSTVDDRVSKW